MRAALRLATAPIFVALVTSCNELTAVDDSCPNVREYGAIPDDGVDDTSALQNALVNDRGCAFVPRGVFIIATPLYIHTDGFVLRGQGPASILRFANTTDVRAEYPSRTGMVNVLASNVTVTELTFDQNFRSSGRVDGDTPVTASLSIGTGDGGTYENISVRACVFEDYYGDAIQGRDGFVRNIRVVDNLFRSAYLWGSWTESGDGGEQAVSFDLGENIIVAGNQIEAALDDAIAFHLDVRNVTVINNTITTTGGRILLNGTSNAVVTSNTITYIEDGATAIFVSREPVNVSPRDELATISTNVLISNNSVFVEAGVTVSGGLIYIYGGDAIRVEGNALWRDELGGYGVRIADREHKDAVYGSRRVVVARNIITNSLTGIAIHIDTKESSGEIELMDNTIFGCRAGRGIVDNLGEPRTLIRNNSVHCID